jgi:hypothetical protein
MSDLKRLSIFFNVRGAYVLARAEYSSSHTTNRDFDSVAFYPAGLPELGMLESVAPMLTTLPKYFNWYGSRDADAQESMQTYFAAAYQPLLNLQRVCHVTVHDHARNQVRAWEVAGAGHSRVRLQPVKVGQVYLTPNLCGALPEHLLTARQAA